MNIKERLLSLKERSTISIKEDYSVSQFFQKNEEFENLFVKAFNNNKNFILLCDKDCDKELICNYFKKFVNNRESIEVIQNSTDDLQFSLATKIIAIEPKIKDIINLLKLTINDFKTFIFAMNLKKYETVINSLSTLIAIELPNLKDENINHLIGSSEAIVVYISMNEDGFYYIKNIGEIHYSNNYVSLDNIYSINIETKKEITIEQQEEETIKIEEVQVQEEIQAIEEPEEKEINPLDENIENGKLKIELDFSQNKKNKYKLLKEKVKKNKQK